MTREHVREQMNVNWTSALWAGLVAGIVMQSVTDILRKIGYTSMDMMGYEGCLITGDMSSIGYWIMTVLHLLISAIGGVIYVVLAQFIFNEFNWTSGLIIGLAHWFISGFLFIATDRFSSCVKKGLVYPMRAFSLGYGIPGFITLFLNHILFAVAIIVLYHK